MLHALHAAAEASDDDSEKSSATLPLDSIRSSPVQSFALHTRDAAAGHDTPVALRDAAAGTDLSLDAAMSCALSRGAELQLASLLARLPVLEAKEALADTLFAELEASRLELADARSERAAAVLEATRLGALAARACALAEENGELRGSLEAQAAVRAAGQAEVNAVRAARDAAAGAAARALDAAAGAESAAQHAAASSWEATRAAEARLLSLSSLVEQASARAAAAEEARAAAEARAHVAEVRAHAAEAAAAADKRDLDEARDTLRHYESEERERDAELAARGLRGAGAAAARAARLLADRPRALSLQRRTVSALEAHARADRAERALAAAQERAEEAAARWRTSAAEAIRREGALREEVRHLLDGRDAIDAAVYAALERAAAQGHQRVTVR